MWRDASAQFGNGSSRKGWQMASGVPGPLGLCAAAWPGDECRRPVVNPVDGVPTWPVAHHRGRGRAGRGCLAADGPSSVVWDRRSGGRRRKSLTSTPANPSPRTSSTTTLQEVPLGGSAESPDVAVVAILPPARFVGMYHSDTIRATTGWARCAVRWMALWLPRRN